MMLLLSILSMLGLVFWTAFEWPLWDGLFVFYSLLKLLLWILFVVITGLNLVTLLRNIQEWRRTCLPVLVCALGFIVLMLTPFTELWLDYNFVIYRDAREGVVQDVIAGTLKPNVAHNEKLITLPESSPTLSLGGNEIVVEVHMDRTYVLFFTFRGVLDNYAGFLWVPVGANPSSFSDLHEKDSSTIERLDQNWYWVSHS